ncbi:MAG: sulfite oxidase-like oxidoreductase [Thaumarchaeota archaeon]|nr:sulfite oxidase-like oxidoreductase [Nitrososphaerota archaeon]
MSPPELPPGQYYGKRWIIYSALSEPVVKSEDWHLKTKGLVDKEIDLSFADMQKLPQTKFTKTFSCVTKWSIKVVVWEGVAFKEIAEMTGVKPEAKWVMFRCADGYSAPVPLEDAMVDESVIAFKMNERPIPPDQGYPARPFIPQLYGWKSAKWLNEIDFIPEYEDGYWEMYGYNERGNIWEEERFKGHMGTHSRRRSLGTAPI